MEKSKHITIIILLAVSLVSPAARAKSPVVLLQEGLYAEQTEGDLDKAIEIYTQVVEELEPSQRIAAKATYQLGMCYLKKGEEAKAAEYFGDVIASFSKQNVLVKKAKRQLVKITPDITPEARPFIVWFKPADPKKITTARQLLDAFNANHPKEASTFRYRTETKNGELIGRIGVNNHIGKEKIVEMLNQSEAVEFIKAQRAYTIIFKPTKVESADAKALLDMFNSNHPRDVSTYYYRTTYKTGSIVGYISTDTEAEKDKLVNMVSIDNDLEMVGIIAPEEQLQTNLYAQLPPAVIGFIGNKYGSICGEAGIKNLYSNSRIYFVNSDFILIQGGMGYYHNWTGQPISSKVKLSGTKKTNVTFYDIAGREMNTEIVADRARPGFYHIYWTPEEPLAPGQFFSYGWALDGSRQLSRSIDGHSYSLTMNNKFGDRCYETFFLVVPEGIVIANQSEPYTNKGNFASWDIYWWKKEVPADTSNIVNVTLGLQKDDLADLIKELHSPTGPRLWVFNKLIEIGEPAVEPLIAKMERSNDWQIPRSLGLIRDKRAVGPLIHKLKSSNFSPMKEVIIEALEKITGKEPGSGKEEWQKWWEENGQFYTPEDTIRNFMSAAVRLDTAKAMVFVAPESHDYEDIKEALEDSEGPFNLMFRKLDVSEPVKIIEATIMDSMCSAVWRVTFKEDFTSKGKTFKKAGETFDLDGNLRKYGDKWLITGI